MRWEVIQPAIRDLVQSMGNLSASGSVEWHDVKANTAYRPAVRIDLDILSSPMLGQDETRREDNAVGAEQTEYQCGNRQIVVQVRCETQDQRYKAQCWNLADKIRTRLSRQASLAALEAAGLSTAEVSGVTNLDFVFEDRLHSVATFEITFNAVENDIDETLGSGDYITQVQLASDTLTGEDGLDTAEQVSETIQGA